MARSTEVRLTALRPDEITNRALTALGPFGRRRPLDNIFATFARHPALLEAYVPLGTYLLRGSTLPPRLRELAVLRVAVLQDCEYEYAQHFVIAQRAGLSAQDVAAVLKPSDAGSWSIAEAAVLRAADELAAEHVISDTTWADLQAELTEEQLLDLVFTLGLYTTLAWALNSLGVPVDTGLAGHAW